MLAEDDLVIQWDEDGRAASPVIDLNLASNLLHVFSMTYTASHTDDAKTYVYSSSTTTGCHLTWWGHVQVLLVTPATNPNITW
jgi:hypothetical protein